MNQMTTDTRLAELLKEVIIENQTKSNGETLRDGFTPPMGLHVTVHSFADICNNCIVTTCLINDLVMNLDDSSELRALPEHRLKEILAAKWGIYRDGPALTISEIMREALNIIRARMESK